MLLSVHIRITLSVQRTCNGLEGFQQKKHQNILNIPSTITDVVPSPTSSSCVRLNSIIDCNQHREEKKYIIKQLEDNKKVEDRKKQNLSSRVSNIQLTQNSIPIISNNNPCKKSHKTNTVAHKTT